MTSTIILPPEHETGQSTMVPSAVLHGGSGAPAHNGGRGTPFPEPRVDKLRGLRLVALWTTLTLGAWAVLGGAGYGLYVVVHSFLL
ncbi:hypothetical protein [Azospirillum doebereinerae]|uniref:Uncharacterized protein n=1 Tax=Azospirillum doebereinerae TaxID=92933 RepID=A0A433J8A7_9PROT|nr:hypothetical protein [Azospirillum doebereinerae]MCG5240367.1 hypothetical protein [Azospirillum doebereinerae]RUQ70237.1 hypothetical protein EJ913_14675 [Azospirillum doebereinerae]